MEKTTSITQKKLDKAKWFYWAIIAFVILLSTVFLALVNPLKSATYYYISGPIHLTSSWKTNPNGTGTSPANFTTGGNLFIIWNSLGGAISPTLTANWTVAGTNTLQIGTSTGSASLTINGGVTLTMGGNTVLRVGAASTANTASVQLYISPNATLSITSGATTPLRVYSNATLTIASSTFPLSNQVSLGTKSTVEWAQNTNVSIWGRTYQNMIISGTGIKDISTTPNTTTIINGKLILNTSTLRMANNTGATLRLNGTISGPGSILTSNSNLNISGTGVFGTISFANGNTAQSIRNLTINRTGPGQITLGTNLTVNGTTTFSVGVLNLNNNTLTLNGAVTFPTATTSGYFVGSRNSSLVIGGAGAITNNLLMSTSTLTTSSLYNFTFNRNNRSITLGNPLRIWGEVSVPNGTIITNGNLFIKADATQKGRIAAIGTNADISGNVTMEVFAKGGTTGWTTLSAAGISGKTFNDWADDFAITCPTCTTPAINYSFTSVYSYSEPAVTNCYSCAAHYVPMNNSTDPITVGKGYYVYLGTSTYTTNNIIIDLNGPIVKKNFGTISLTRTGAISTQNGWNLIGNPYPSPISFANILSSMGSGSVNIENTIYVYNPDLNSGSGDFATYKPGIGSVPPVSAGGVDDNIPAGQGFFVRAINPVNLSPNENWKTTLNNQNNLLRTISPLTTIQSTLYDYPPSLFILEMKGPSNYDVFTGIAIHPNATTNFDNNYDATHLGSDPPAPQIMSVLNGYEYKINTIPPVVGTTTMEIKAITGTTGTYTIFPLNIQNFSNGYCISLYDKLTGITTDLHTSAYTFTLINTTTTPRFILSITNSAVSATASVIQHASCNSTSDGMIAIQSSAYPNFDVVWKANDGTVITTHTNVTNADTLKNLPPGVYFCEVSVPSSCASSVYSFTVQAQNSIYSQAAFSLSTNSVLPLDYSNPIIAQNTSTNATSILWELVGDGYTSTSNTFSYMPSDTGEYILRLYVFNSCNDVSIAEQYIHIINGPDGPFGGPIYDSHGNAIGMAREMTSNTATLSEEVTLIGNKNDGYFLFWTGQESENFSISINDLSGRVLYENKNYTLFTGQNSLQNILEKFSAQLLILNIENTNKIIHKSFKILKE
ncbi:MAG: polymer-forming cytoskeletal protein [Bacteroidia bacterium]|nr:polymer-forming cytoskeletal protein [Bacteroidia bacterium]